MRPSLPSTLAISCWCSLLLLVPAAAQERLCDVCAIREPFMTSPFAVLTSDIFPLAQDTECSEVRELALAGAYTYVQCLALRVNGADEVCGCRAMTLGPATIEPGAPVSMAPTVSPTMARPTILSVPTIVPTIVATPEVPLAIVPPPIVEPLLQTQVPTLYPSDSPIVPPPIDPPVTEDTIDTSITGTTDTGTTPTEAPATATTEQLNSDSGISGGAVVGILVAVAVGLAVIACVLKTCLCLPAAESSSSSSHWKDGLSESHPQPVVAPAFDEEAGPDKNDDSSDSDIKSLGSTYADSGVRNDMTSRNVVAPAGKLGIVIDTTLDGPVVHKVNASSPLLGTLFCGDIIVAIGDVDTRAMPAAQLNQLMRETSHRGSRVMTIRSHDVSK